MRKVFFLIFMITQLFFISACSEEGESKANNEEIVTPVETESVETGDFVVEKSIYGQISPIKQTPVLVQQPGEVTSLKVENGDEVKKNDHLATIQTGMGSEAIYAPTDGEIAQIHVQEKSFQSNEEPLALIVELEKLQANFAVTPSTRKQFKQDEEMTVFVDDKKYQATVMAMDSMPNETGQFPISMEIDNEERDILPGKTAKLIISDKRVKDTIIVPTEAVITESDESFVFIVSDNTAKKVVVDLKETQSDKVAVEAELEKDDQVIVNGQVTLSDGSKVEVVKEGK